MRRSLTAFMLAALLTGLLAGSDSATAGPDDASHPTVSIEDFQALEGDDWTGQLTYLNYGSDERSSIPVKIQIREARGRTLKYAIQYPGEEEYNAKERLKLSRDGRSIDGFDVVRRFVETDGALMITTLGEGRDDGRPADIQMVYRLSPQRFSIRKDVRFEGEDAFFSRNEYAFER